MAKKRKFSVAPWSKFSEDDANIIGPEIVRILDKHGESKPEVIVNEAADIKSPLHPYFTWDNDEAADLYRIEEARYMLRKIRIEVLTTEEKEPIIVNIASSLTRPNIGHVYQRTDVILKNKSDRRQLLDTAWRELESFMIRYSNFIEFEPIFKVIRLQMKKHK